MGRYYAMDRELKWDRVSQAYAAMVYGEGVKNADPVDAIRKSYAEGVTDEFIQPVVCTSEKISANDSVIFYNFRPDRARERSPARLWTRTSTALYAALSSRFIMSA